MSSRKGFTLTEVSSIYVEPADRFIVSLVVGYGKERIVKTPKQAAAAALVLTQDADCDGTVWFVYDRKTGQMHQFSQRQFEIPWVLQENP